MMVGDLVQLKDARYHKEVGVITELIENVLYEGKQIQVKVYWADGRVLWERQQWLKAVKKCP